MPNNLPQPPAWAITISGDGLRRLARMVMGRRFAAALRKADRIARRRERVPIAIHRLGVGSWEGEIRLRQSVRPATIGR